MGFPADFQVLDNWKTPKYTFVGYQHTNRLWSEQKWNAVSSGGFIDSIYMIENYKIVEKIFLRGKYYTSLLMQTMYGIIMK